MMWPVEKRAEEHLKKEPPKPQPLAEVTGRGGQQQVEAVACEAAQVVARQAEVAFEVGDGRFNGAAPPEALPHGLAVARALPGGRFAGHEDLRAADFPRSTMAAIDDGFGRAFALHHSGLFEHLGQGVAVVAVRVTHPWVRTLRSLPTESPRKQAWLRVLRAHYATPENAAAVYPGLPSD